LPQSSGKLLSEAESLSAVFVPMACNNIHGVTDVISTAVSAPHLAIFRKPGQLRKFRFPTAVFRTRTVSSEQTENVLPQCGNNKQSTWAVKWEQTVVLTHVDILTAVECRKHCNYKLKIDKTVDKQVHRPSTRKVVCFCFL